MQVEFLGQIINPFNHKPWNLHAVWDSAIVEHQDQDAEHYAKRLEVSFDSQPLGLFIGGSVVDWAMESHDVAKHHVYVLPKSRQLGPDYVDASVQVVDQQLFKAGLRLAKCSTKLSLRSRRAFLPLVHRFPLNAA